MVRKGQQHLDLIVGIVIALIVLVIVIFFHRQIGGAWSDFVTCQDDLDEYYCSPNSVGCGEGDSKLVWKIDGCRQGEYCCATGAEEDDGLGPGGVRHPILRVHEVFLAEQVIRDTDPVSSGSTLPVIVDAGKLLLVEVEDCEENCEATFTFKLETMAGEEVLNAFARWTKLSDDPVGKTLDGLDEITVTELKPGSDLLKKSNYKMFNFTNFDERTINQRFKFTVELEYTVTPEDTDEEEPEPVTGQETHVVYLDIKPAVRIGGLTSRWEQEKTITAICENPVRCQNIYYTVIPGEPENPPTSCPDIDPDKAGAAVQISTQRDYCLVNRYGVQIDCRETQEACVNELLSEYVTDEHVAVQQILEQTELDEELPDMVKTWFQDQENLESMYSCQPGLAHWKVGDTDTYTGANIDTDQWFVAERPVAQEERWRFNLDMPFMTGQYLCVAGQSAANPGQFYSFGRPQEIKIDRIPPRAKIDFDPFTLRITLTCDDDHSGCADYVGLAYVSKLTDYFQALAGRGGPQRAVLYCPPYETGAGYRPETRSIIPYTDEAVRVLCMRAVDRAGNAGVSMATVYNGYEMLASTLYAILEDNP